jgi:hypothetical protein
MLKPALSMMAASNFLHALAAHFGKGDCVWIKYHRIGGVLRVWMHEDWSSDGKDD